MPSLEEHVARHYGRAGLEEAILRGISALGRDPESMTEDDLAVVDEFHMGGRQATADIAARLDLGPDSHVLDIGCGIGGTARYLAHRHHCRLIGIDVTAEYVAVAKRLTTLVGLAHLVRHELGSATEIPLPDHSVDVALLLHVGMNVPDKAALCAEAARVVRRGGSFVVYDVMRVGDGEIDYPVPWAASSETSFVASRSEYREFLLSAGFEVVEERDRRGLALDQFRRTQAIIAEKGLPPLGLHLLMGGDAVAKIANMVSNLEAGRIAPIELMCRRP